MARTIRKLRLVGAIALLAAIVTVLAVWGGRSPQQFTFAEEDSSPALTLTLGGGSTGAITTLRAYASGTAELETIWGGRVIESAEMTLSRDELEEMLSLIAFGGIVDYDEEVVRAEMLRLQKDPAQVPGAPQDLPMFILEFAIERVASARSEPVMIRRRIQIQAPDVMSSRYPAIRSLRSLAELQARLVELAESIGGQR